MFLRPFDLYFSACFGSLFVSILCTCFSHFSWYCFISCTMFCAPVFCLIHWFFSLSNFVIPSKCLKYFICAASKRCSSLFFSTQTSLPNFKWSLGNEEKRGHQVTRKILKRKKRTDTQYIVFMFCIYLRTNSDLCHLQHKLIGFYNRDEKCLQRGTDWVFK